MLERIWQWLGYDIVIVFCAAENRRRFVRWRLGRPFVCTHGPDTTTELLPDGSCDGVCFAYRWKALTPRIHEWSKRIDAELEGE